MLGTIVNVSTIITGSVIGSFLSRGIKENYKTALFDGLGLATVGLGVNAFVSNMPKVQYPVLFIARIALGTLLGTYLNLNGKFHGLLERAKGGSRLAEGLSTAILLFCIGTLSILGPIESRLNGNNTYLFTNATLDFVSSIGISLWRGHCHCGAGAVLLAGKYLPICRSHCTLYDTRPFPRNICIGWHLSHKLGLGHLADTRLQNAEYAALAFSAAAVLLAGKNAGLKRLWKNGKTTNLCKF